MNNLDLIPVDTSINHCFTKHNTHVLHDNLIISIWYIFLEDFNSLSLLELAPSYPDCIFITLWV